MTSDQTLHDLRTSAELRAVGEEPAARPVPWGASVVIDLGGLRAVMTWRGTLYERHGAGDRGGWGRLPPGEVPAILRELAAAVRAVRWPVG